VKLRSAFVVAFVAAVGGCDVLSDTGVHTYPTLADVHREHVIGKGWLPDILPPSTFAITTRNNLKFNFSIGEFSLAPQEMPLLTTRMKRGAITMGFADWSETVEDYADDGYRPWYYQDDDSTWAIFCKAEIAHCEYFMERRR
jgi:hypothetical protein